MKMLVLMQGIPGSGKSTLARQISFLRNNAPIFSTDDFWVVGPGNTKKGEYTFNPAWLGLAHRWNRLNVELAMTVGKCDTVIIDNTNIRRSHVRPYLELAAAYGFEVLVERIECSPQVAFERGTHNVPFETVERMAREMEDLLKES